MSTDIPTDTPTDTLDKSQTDSPDHPLRALAEQIKRWGEELGFQAVGISNVELKPHEAHLNEWLADGLHGEMDYMARHGSKRSRPAELEPGTLSVISVRMDYLPEQQEQAAEVLADPTLGYVSRYALGRDYHKLMRKRLSQLAQRIKAETGAQLLRPFVDSAPVLEKGLAERSGLGWIGKHTNLLHQRSGSWFFLGEIYADLDLPVDQAAVNHCGHCTDCIDICPTQAIIAPYRLDARRCISYLTIENHGPIPIEFRRAIGNRIYGCDDCQLVCPWNRFARLTQENDFSPRHQLDKTPLTTLMDWSEAEFAKRLEGNPIRRIGHIAWLRNIAIALGNGPPDAEAILALNTHSHHSSALVREHVSWALDQLK